ncbi:MAG: hypothetical protein FJX72_05720 [Armatimonadetes bacterium]|nr:hypothetical protein [Armatimonadota bacterium]
MSHEISLVVALCAMAVCAVLPEASAEPTLADAPEWIVRRFPHTGAPDRLGHRLKLIGGTDMGASGGSVMVEFRYPGLDGKDATGMARIFLPPILRTDPAARVPMIHNAGYELDEGSGKALAQRGYLVSTPHAHPLNPLGRCVHVDRAILHAVRALPFVDARRVSIQGGSAGGWMTLMLAADAFPLVWVAPDVPPIHWGYNAAYIGENQKLAGPAPGSDQPRMPVLQVVGPIADQSRDLYGVPFDHPAYVAVSPIGRLDTITAPTQVTFSTADMLVPIAQVNKDLIRPHDPKLFPEGFTIAMSDRFPAPGGKRTLLAALPKGDREVFVVPPPASPARLKPDGSAGGTPHAATLPFSKTRIWSVVVLDEGPVEPEVGHFKYAWGLDREPFKKWAEGQGVRPEQLTRRKLEGLMKRMIGEASLPMQVRAAQGREYSGNLLDYPEAERADVIGGLRAFAADDACAMRLHRLYRALARTLKALGPSLGRGDADGVRRALAEMR